MYHGDVVPGFPAHPHRGFETVTLVRRGRIDHADSLGATARFGGGDVQWMTAGNGIVHSEMFPLLHAESGNHAELFQIWLNLPARSKRVKPYFTMLWAETIPVVNAAGARVTVVAGTFGEATGPGTPPDSWAADPAHEVAIWTVALADGASLPLPLAARGTSRVLYVFDGEFEVAGQVVSKGYLAVLDATAAVALRGRGASEALVLQGKPIGEPVVSHGPFVMNTATEIHEAYTDYRSSGFGGWPWKRRDPVHPREQGRFARHADGRVETREG